MFDPPTTYVSTECNRLGVLLSSSGMHNMQVCVARTTVSIGEEKFRSNQRQLEESQQTHERSSDVDGQSEARGQATEQHF